MESSMKGCGTTGAILANRYVFTADTGFCIHVGTASSRRLQHLDNGNGNHNTSGLSLNNLLLQFYQGVGIATGWRARVIFPAVQEFCLFYSVQTGSGAHPPSYTMGIGGSFLGAKAAGA
jgi:hypothetical protein